MAGTKQSSAPVGLARALSKLGFCSRSQAHQLIAEGKVRVNGVVRRQAQYWVQLGRDRLEVDGQPVQSATKVYLMLNKPRGLVSTTADEHGRPTVLSCFNGCGLPLLSPVGRLDKASEGLLLFTNDTLWAARVTAPATHLDKTYHVQVDCQAEQPLLERMVAGVEVDGDYLVAKRVRLLRSGTVNSWLEIVLDEGKNRHIRRLLGALDVQVLRLVRVAIGDLPLGNLPKGQFRHLTPGEVRKLGAAD